MRNTDTVPAMLTPGEFVIRKDAADQIGPENLHMMNNVDRLSNTALLENAKSPMGYQKGGKVKIEDYFKSGHSYSKEEWDTLYRDYFGDKYGGGDVGLEHAQEYEYKPNVLEKFLDILPGIGGKRAYQRASDYGERVHHDPAAAEERERQFEKEISAYSKLKSDMVSENDKTVKDIFMSGSLQHSTEDPRNFLYSMGVSDMDRTKINQFIQGSDIGHTVSEDDARLRSVDPYNIAQTERGRDLFGFIPMGYKGSVRKNPGIDPMLDIQQLKAQIDNMKTAQFIPGMQQGGEVMNYQNGGQMSDVLSVFGEKSKQGDEMQKLMAMAAMQQMQRAQQIQQAVGMQEGGYADEYQQGGTVQPPMPSPEAGPQEVPMSGGDQTYHKPAMEQLDMDQYEYQSYIKYGPDMYKWMAQNYKPKTEWTAYDSLVDAGTIDPYEVSKDSLNVITDDQMDALREKMNKPSGIDRLLQAIGMRK